MIFLDYHEQILYRDIFFLVFCVVCRKTIEKKFCSHRRTSCTSTSQPSTTNQINMYSSGINYPAVDRMETPTAPMPENPPAYSMSVEAPPPYNKVVLS